MSRQVELQVRLELLSDTIFGSGHSIPGGEDIAVCQDENGYPYLKGTTFKACCVRACTICSSGAAARRIP